MDICRIQCQSCFDDVSFKVDFWFSKFEEVESLRDGFNIPSVNLMLYQWGIGEISNTGSEDIWVFLKGGMHWLALAGQQVTVGKALGWGTLTNWFWGSVGG